MDELGRQRELGELFLALCFAVMAALGAWLAATLLTLFGTIGALTSLTLYIWQRTCLMRLTYQRTIDETCADFGQQVTIGIELINDKILPLPWVRVIDHFPCALFSDRSPSPDAPSSWISSSDLPVVLTNSPSVKQQVASLSELAISVSNVVPDDLFEYTQSFAMLPFQRVHRTINVVCRYRGRHRFGDSQVISGDPLGIRPRTMHLKHTHELIVYPKIFSLQMPSIFTRIPLGEDRARQHLLGDPTRIAGMRPYREGDPLRHVDWRATARRSELLVRDFEPTTTLRLELFVDCQLKELDDAESSSSPSEFAIALAASIVNWANGQGIPIGIHTNGTADGQPIATQPVGGPLANTHLLELLALCEPQPEQHFDEQLLLASAHLKRGSTVIVIAADFTQELLVGMAECRRRSPVIVIHLVDLDGMPPPRNLVDASFQVAYRPNWQGDDHVTIV